MLAALSLLYERACQLIAVDNFLISLSSLMRQMQTSCCMLEYIIGLLMHWGLLLKATPLNINIDDSKEHNWLSRNKFICKYPMDCNTLEWIMNLIQYYLVCRSGKGFKTKSCQAAVNDFLFLWEIKESTTQLSSVHSTSARVNVSYVEHILWKHSVISAWNISSGPVMKRGKGYVVAFSTSFRFLIVLGWWMILSS